MNSLQLPPLQLPPLPQFKESSDLAVSSSADVEPGLSGKRRANIAFADELAGPVVYKKEPVMDSVLLPSFDEFSSKWAHIQRVQGLRYTRIGRKTWTVSNMAIYDAQCLLSFLKENVHYNQQVFLVDSQPSSSPILQINSQFTPSDSTMTNNNNNHIEFISLRNALIGENVLVTDWSVNDPQFLLFWSILKSVSSRNLIDIWNNNNNSNFQTGSDVPRTPRGYLAVEVDMRIIFCVRKSIPVAATSLSSSPSLSMTSTASELATTTNTSKSNSSSNNNNNNKVVIEDMWCHLYQEELLFLNATHSIGDLLMSLFPQLHSQFTAQDYPNTIVKYKPLPLGDGAQLPRFDASGEVMETIGCLDKRSTELLCKLSPHQVCHNFVLEFCSV
jgi:hypothetical protein